MIAIERKPETNSRSAHRSGLFVEPSDITFQDLPGEVVRIQVVVHNTGLRRSAPTLMRLESAPLGAFVTWRPLARLVVPSLQSGESRQLSVDVPRPNPAPLGDFNRVPPGKLIAAVSSPDGPSPSPGGGITALLNLFRKERPAQDARGDLAQRTSLAPDLWDLAGRKQPYWAGNINVFIGHQSVERHMARALRIYPGRTNLAIFMVGGSGGRDAYSFELAGLGSDWETGLYDARNNRNLLINPSAAPIEEKEWVEAEGRLLVMLATCPPANCQAGDLEVRVTQRSSEKQALVEFNLDPAAQGPGCYCA